MKQPKTLVMLIDARGEQGEIVLKEIENSVWAIVDLHRDVLGEFVFAHSMADFVGAFRPEIEPLLPPRYDDLGETGAIVREMAERIQKLENLVLRQRGDLKAMYDRLRGRTEEEFGG